ncbi:MAG: ATP-binding cassette domain-containing protein [Candidatus Marinimicrobia bacterium]|nr:ATP-binding cassette domain-containing protein [Candidatus Neomarinimicrobiota bacterium]
MIHVENLTKDYGEIKAVKGINFTVNDGEILGFLGPNGAGKSTTLRIMTTFLAPTSGTVTLDGYSIHEHPTEVRRRIGYLPELNPLYGDMVVHDLLKFVAGVRGITGKAFKSALGRVMGVCGIGEVMHRTVRELSKGYKQRVGLAMAIIHDPEILILDEPSAGLDPNQIVEIRQLIKDLGKEKTVILSSHILQEVQAVADRMIILNNGEVVADGTNAELMASFQGKAQLIMEVKNASAASIKALPQKIPDISIQGQSAHGNVRRVQLEYPTGHDLREQVFKYAVESGWTILEMSRQQAQLEDVFRSLTLMEGGRDA